MSTSTSKSSGSSSSWAGSCSTRSVYRSSGRGGRPIAYVAELFPGLTRIAYGLMARHRGTLGRLIGVEACSVDPSAIEV
jgi:hypothetical protein